MARCQSRLRTTAGIRSAAPLVAVILLASAHVDALRAQVPAGAGDVALAGRVVDAATGRPVPLATVIAPARSVRVLTDSLGRFLMPPLPGGGQVTLVVQALGYQDAEIDVDVRPGAEVVVRLEAQPLPIDGLDVTSQRRRVVREQLDRRMQAWSYRSTVSGPLDLLTSDETRLVDYLAEEARAFLKRCPSDELFWEVNCMRFGSRLVRVSVCIDDVPAPGGGNALHRFSPGDLHRVEVIPDLHQVRLYTAAYFRRQGRSGSTIGAFGAAGCCPPELCPYGRYSFFWYTSEIDSPSHT